MKKEADEPIERSLSDAYFAGFFDSEGTVEAFGFNQIRTRCPQKYRPICDAYQLRFEGGVCYSGGKYHWNLNHADKCIKMLHAIQPYSIEKLPQIDLVLNMKNNEAPIVNQALKQYKGNQLGRPAPEKKEPQQPKKRLHGLPRYITITRKKGEICGYVANYKGKSRRFASSHDTMEVKLAKAIERLEEMKREYAESSK